MLKFDFSLYFHTICKIISSSLFFTESERLMTHTKFFMETLAPLFIAVLVIAGLAAIVSGQLTLTGHWPSQSGCRGPIHVFTGRSLSRWLVPSAISPFIEKT